MIKRPLNLARLHRIICFTSLLLHLFTCFLLIFSPTNRSHRQSHHLSLSLSHHLSHIDSHLSMRFLTCIIICIIIISRNTISTRTSHHHPLFTSSHAMSSTLSPPQPPIPAFHAPFPCMLSSLPSPLIIHTSKIQQQIQHATIRSLTCKVLFLSVQGSVPSHVIIGSNMQGSVPYHARFCSLPFKVPLQHVIIRS